jgi:histidinol phosphatase-like PHP family hydrolase
MKLLSPAPDGMWGWSRKGLLRRSALIDFHTHTLFSDGELVPSELVRRAHHKGYRAIGITDHVDGSNLDFIIQRILKVARELNEFQNTLVIPGVEITHAPPGQIPELVAEARRLGAVVVVVHGETLVEPVAPGTNRAAIESCADILAHPGLISLELAHLARKNGVALEITSRHGHSLTNGHVARMALEAGARLLVNTDTHSPGNLITHERAFEILMGAGLTEAQAQAVFAHNEKLLADLKKRL